MNKTKIGTLPVLKEDTLSGIYASWVGKPDEKWGEYLDRLDEENPILLSLLKEMAESCGWILTENEGLAYWYGVVNTYAMLTHQGEVDALNAQFEDN